MPNLYDVNFNIYTSITVEADSREEAEDKLLNTSDDEILERIAVSLREGGVDIGTVELLEGEEPEDMDF